MIVLGYILAKLGKIYETIRRPSSVMAHGRGETTVKEVSSELLPISSNKGTPCSETAVPGGHDDSRIRGPWSNIIKGAWSKVTGSPDPGKLQNGTATDIAQSSWHLWTPHTVSVQLQVDPCLGLSVQEAVRRLARDGHNAPSPPPTHYFRTGMGYFFGGFGSILLAGSILVFLSWKPLGEPPVPANLALAVVMLAVFFIQAGFNMYQDWSSSKVMSSVKEMLPQQCWVRRGGSQMLIEAKNLVLGDVVIIQSGSLLPADLRFIEMTAGAVFDRSLVTGESKAIEAAIESTNDKYLESRNIGLQGTTCSNGSGVGIVIATGDSTIFGHVAFSANKDNAKLTTLEKEVRNFVWLISAVMTVMILAVIALWAAWLRVDHPKWINVSTLIVDCVSVAVAFIPEGLPIAITAGLTITAALMKKNKILCKSLKSVESLGAVSVICTDKTGTLTHGKMTVTECVVGMQLMTADAARDRCAAELEGSSVKVLGALSSLCNAVLCKKDPRESGDKKSDHNGTSLIGDATDKAIFAFCETMQTRASGDFKSKWKLVHEVSFDSKYKYMIRCYNILQKECLVNTLPFPQSVAFKDDDVLLTKKGAPDAMFPHCTHYVSSRGTVLPLDAEGVRFMEEKKNNLSAQGRRCLVVAYKVVPGGRLPKRNGRLKSRDDVEKECRSEMILAGLIAISDPLRPGIPSTIACLRRAGIRVAMVTGDFSLTGVSHAREAGILTSRWIDDVSALRKSPVDTPVISKETDRPDEVARAAFVISGHELVDLNSYQWEQLTQYEEIVFARTTPDQKLRIVQEFQRNNVVAMTGDGVNDAPSLKAADVGICMGNGCDLAKEAADMVLLGSFDSMVVAVQYGRVVFDNMKKVIAYLLPAGSFSEFWPVMTSVVFGLPQILSSFLMIVICCLTDCLAATMLSYEKPEADVLLRKPRNPKKERLVNAKLILHAYGLIGLLETLISFTLAFWYLERKGIPFRELFMSYGRLREGVDPVYFNKQLNTASSIYFVNLVVMQWFNLMATRTRRLSIFHHPPAFSRSTQNLYLFPAMLFAMAMAAIFIYIPGLQKIIATANVPVEYWILPIVSGMLLILVDEGRRFAARKWPDGIIARLAW